MSLVWMLMLKGPLVAAYSVPQGLGWPTKSAWRAFGHSLSGANGSSLWSFGMNSAAVCARQGNALSLTEVGHGVCMQDLKCEYERCDEELQGNLPAYSATMRNVLDVQRAVAFAAEHNVSISIKTSGHSYAGSSTMKGSLLLWMSNFEQYNTVSSHTDTCGTPREHVLKVGGGTLWGEAYEAAESAGREIVGGGASTVGAAGGWLQGGGLSVLARNLSYGIDNVVAFDVVLPNASVVTADACSHSDLYWALRGGGGGTFGVVTAAYYRTYEAIPVQRMRVSIDEGAAWSTIDSWIDFWVDKSPSLEHRWAGGYWNVYGVGPLYFRGPRADADATFIDEVMAWREALPAAEQGRVAIGVRTLPRGYVASRMNGCRSGSSNPGCQEFGLPTSDAGTFTLSRTTQYSRMLPSSWAVANGGSGPKTFFKWLARQSDMHSPNWRGGQNSFSYFLGGAVNDVASDATAINPSVRESWANIFLYNDRSFAQLNAALSEAGEAESVCYNHAGHHEPDFETAAWGSNLARLRTIKQLYDPGNLFNCWNCVGYEPISSESLTPDECDPDVSYNCYSPSNDMTVVGIVVAVVGVLCLLITAALICRRWHRKKQGGVAPPFHIRLRRRSSSTFSRPSFRESADASARVSADASAAPSADLA